VVHRHKWSVGFVVGPTIILDKSALQSLSQREVSFLSKYYYVVNTPVLITEVLADLRKGGAGSILSKDEAKKVSRKIPMVDSVINLHFRHICLMSLVGDEVPLIGQAVVPPGLKVNVPGLGTGVVLDETEITRKLIDWQSGIFCDSEEELATRWREALDTLDLEDEQRKLRPWMKDIPKITSIRDLGLYVDSFASLAKPEIQFSCLKSFLRQILVSKDNRNAICSRWLEANLPFFKDFAPYAYYCFRANVIFYLGLSSRLISTRSSNWIDLEYMYYLPFCTVFCSNDKFHENLSPLFLRADQQFIDGHVLKEDLNWLATEWETLGEQEKRDRVHVYGNYPPVDPESVTYELWQKHMKPWKPGSADLAFEMPEEEMQRIIRKMKPVLDAARRLRHSDQ
jgi:hypothetical protein